MNVSINDLKSLISEAVAENVRHLQPPQAEPELLTRGQVAQILGISLPTLNDWTKRGLLPALKIGSRVRYRKHQVYDSLKEIETIKYKRA